VQKSKPNFYSGSDIPSIVALEEALREQQAHIENVENALRELKEQLHNLRN
jgi:cysteine sulfinate desulfinase/cysteine desulfurase-like protein